MRDSKKNNVALDKLGMWLSGACAIHCAVLPVMIAFGVGSGLSWMLNHEFELIFLSISLCIASYSLIEGYLRVHNNLSVVVLALIGFVMLIIGHEMSSMAITAILSTIGGMCILISHLINYRLRNQNCNLAVK